MQLSLFGLLLLTQPLGSSEQHTKANLEFPSNFEPNLTWLTLLSEQELNPRLLKNAQKTLNSMYYCS